MCDRPAWLPEELHYNDYDGDWDRFLADVYAVFVRDFKQSKPSYQSFPITYDANIEDGKEAVFWHIIQREDSHAGIRVPDFERCERIPWPRPMIEHPADSAISVWENIRNRQTRVLIWLEQFDYLVVLAKRPKAIILVTAYCTDFAYTRKKLIKERDEYCKKMQKPPL
jgi:hypothetical protein